MNRREILKSIGAFVLSPLIANYYFDQKVVIEGCNWKIFSKNKTAMPILLEPETLEPYRPLKPVLVKERIGFNYKGESRKFPDVIAENQQILCQHAEGKGKEITIVT